MAVMEPTEPVSQDTVEFAVLEAGAEIKAQIPLVEEAPRTGRAKVVPFRSRSADLVDLFGTADAGTPWWHRTRARDLRRQAHAHPVASVTDAYLRLAARHIATAQLLEDTGDCWAATA